MWLRVRGLRRLRVWLRLCLLVLLPLLVVLARRLVVLRLCDRAAAAPFVWLSRLRLLSRMRWRGFWLLPRLCLCFFIFRLFGRWRALLVLRRFVALGLLGVTGGRDSDECGEDCCADSGAVSWVLPP